MMPSLPDRHSLEALRAWDTPTICNALEIVVPARRASGFFVLAGSIMPSHAHVHLVEFGGTVTVGGMVVSPNDIIHADRHGAVVIPPEAVGKIPEAIDLLTRREKVLIEASKQPGFSVDRLRQAYREQDEIH